MLKFLVKQKKKMFAFDIISGAHFMNNFSIIVHSQWKLQSDPIQVVMLWWLWNFAHGITAVLLSHMQIFFSDMNNSDRMKLHYAYMCYCVVLCYNFVLFKWSHFLQGYLTDTGAVMAPIWLPQCQWSNPEEYEHIGHTNLQRMVNITVTKHQSQHNHMHFFMGYTAWQETVPMAVSLAI